MQWLVIKNMFPFSVGRARALRRSIGARASIDKLNFNVFIFCFDINIRELLYKIAKYIFLNKK